MKKFSAEEFRNAWYQSVQKVLSCCLQTKIIEIKRYRSIGLPVLSYSCEMCSVVLQDRHSVRVFWEYGAEQDKWDEERGCNRWLDKTV